MMHMALKEDNDLATVQAIKPGEKQSRSMLKSLNTFM